MNNKYKKGGVRVNPTSFLVCTRLEEFAVLPLDECPVGLNEQSLERFHVGNEVYLLRVRPLDVAHFLIDIALKDRTV